MSLIEEYLIFLETDVQWFYRIASQFISSYNLTNITRQIDKFVTHQAIFTELLTNLEDWNLSDDYRELVLIPMIKMAEKQLREYYNKIPLIQKQIGDLGIPGYIPVKLLPGKLLTFYIPTRAQLNRLSKNMMVVSMN